MEPGWLCSGARANPDIGKRNGATHGATPLSEELCS
jgi:hypothetical protein